MRRYDFRPSLEMPQIYLYREPVDFRKSFRGLAAIVEQELEHNPFSGAINAPVGIVYGQTTNATNLTLDVVSVTFAWDGGGDGSRAINEYLDALHEDGSSITPAKKVSQTDPMARWTAAPGGPAYYAYSSNYLVDTEAGIIVDVEATTALRTQEVWSTKAMIERVQERFNLKAQKLIGDTAYGTAEFLSWMVEEAGIEPHVPVWDMGDKKAAGFGRSDFHYDEQTDCYTCPGGKQLLRSRRNYSKPRTGIPKDGFIRYRAALQDRTNCSLKTQCCPNTKVRKILRSQHENVRDVARAVGKTAAYQRTRRDRKKVEMLFAHMKRILKMDRLRLRGLSGARDEFLLTATAQNLRRMAKCLGTGPPKILGTAPV